MDRDTELTAYLLRYLHDNHYFKSMEEMAEKFDISKRHVQRLVNDAESLKGGSIALSKILQYFGLHNIPFEPILLEFVSKTVRRNEASEIQLEKPYLRIKLPQPNDLTAEGLAAYEYCKEFVGIVSSYICPDCRAWCNPWDGTEKVKGQHCFIAQLTNVMLQSVVESYSKRT